MLSLPEVSSWQVADGSPERLHRALNRFGNYRLDPNADARPHHERLRLEFEYRLLEGAFVERERAQFARTLKAVPRRADEFVAWFERLKEDGPGQNDPLFPWLASQASLDEMKWFLEQEVAGEAGFEDLVAMTQVKLPARAKLELARNYWDEMGRGSEGGMHGPMLGRLARELDLNCEREVVWESLALGNLMVALACNRELTYQSVGALGAIELTAPWRAAHVNAGLKRLGIGGEARRYFALHATLDIKHSEAWNREVLMPLVSEDPARALPIAEGALMRLNAGRRCFERYRREFGLRAERAA